MSEPTAPMSFSLPRLSRFATRQQDSDPAWTLHLSTVLLGALFAFSILGPFMTMTDATAGRYSSIRQLAYFAIFALTLVALRPWKQPQRVLIVPWPLLLALGWCWLSLAWALDPAAGARRLLLTTIIIWSLFALVRRIGIDRTETVLRVLLVATLAVNYYAVFFRPEIGIEGPETGDLAYKWCGIMAQKNYAGITCAALILLLAFDAKRLHWALRVALAAASAYFLYRSNSKTSINMLTVALVVGGLLMLPGRPARGDRLAPAWVAWLLLAIPAAIYLTMAVDPQPFLQAVSDPGGFTGRTQIWTALIKAYHDRPVLGVGFGSFWDLGPGGPIFNYASGWVTQVSEGHNGYLDLLVQVGAVGTSLVIFAALVWPTQRLVAGGQHSARPLAAALVVFSIGHNFTESQLFDRDALVEVLIMIAIAMMWMMTAAAPGGEAARAPRTRRRRTAAPRAPLRL